MKKITSSLIFLFAIIHIGNTQPGQQIVGSQIFLVTEIKPDNSRYADFENAVISHICRAQANKLPMSWALHSTMDGQILYFMGIRNYAALDDLRSKSALPFQPAWLDTIESYNQSIISFRQYILRIRDDLSYIPEKHEVIKNPIVIWDKMYCRPGSKKEMDSLFLTFKGLSKKVDYFRIYRVLQGDLGIDGNLYITVFDGEDLGDLWMKRQQLFNQIGYEANEIEKQMLSHLLKREILIHQNELDLIKQIKEQN